jgi:hypothetical protein
MSEILYDHYKETCNITAEVIKRRDRLLIYVVLTLALLVIQGILPEVSVSALNNILNHQFGITTSIDLSIIGSAVWFLLLLFILRYCQTSIFVERQYTYLHELEDRIENGLISREGKSYLSNYPIFSDWMWLLYTVIFPALLLLIVLVKAGSEITFACFNGWSFTTSFNLVISVLILVSVSLYLFSLHSKKKK